jgi:drug/metabolite transporter (DMT)-like permease
MGESSGHAKGLIIVLLGVLVLTPDVLLIRLAGVDHWHVLIWRGLAQAIGVTTILLALNGRATPGIFRAVGSQGLLAAMLLAASSLMFVIALSHTTAANVLIILAITPFFAALTSRAFLGEAIGRRTWLAIAAAVGGMVLLALDSMDREALIGDLIALGAAFTLGSSFTALRRGRKVNMLPAIAIGGLLFAAISWWQAPETPLGRDQMTFLFLMCLIVPVSSALVATGLRYLPAPEVSLLTQIEVVLGPLWVWLVIDEAPGPWALAGGIVVISTLTIHSLLTLRGQVSEVR